MYKQQEENQQNKASWLRRGVAGGSVNSSKLRRGAEGQALVEFALTLPFIIMLLVVLVELGFLIRSHMNVTAAVREGARVVSLRGNADPSILNGYGNDVNKRVGADGDTSLVQNINTALGREGRREVTMLMSYRADVTDDTNTIVTDVGQANKKVATVYGIYGLGGAYGVYYNPDISTKPFQEIFDYEERTVDGRVERWFKPAVMTSARCATIYPNSEDANPGGNSVKNIKGNQPPAGHFCGDASPAGIKRTIPLGVKIDGTNDNIGPVNTKPESAAVGSPSCGATSAYQQYIRCWRYNFAPWYPSLRRAQDVGLIPTTDIKNKGSYNTQETTAAEAAKFGTADTFYSPDYVGVRINYTHLWFTPFVQQAFGGSTNIALSDRSAKIMEPVGGSYEQPMPDSGAK